MNSNINIIIVEVSVIGSFIEGFVEVEVSASSIVNIILRIDSNGLLELLDNIFFFLLK